MNKEFIPYEQALELKELGFNEPCFGRYWIKDFQLRSPKNYNADNEKIDSVSAPTFSQAFRWFREKNKLHAVVDINISDEWYFLIFNLNVKRNAEVVKKDEYYNTYEEAELACLNKLIEIVKQPKKN